MKTTRGNHRVLNDAQVQRVLAWHSRLETWQAERQKVPTLRAFARANGIDARTLRRQLPKLAEKIDLFLRIREWHDAQLRLLAARAQIETLRDMARELGVSDKTIQYVVRCHGEYKQASPELHAELRARRRAHLERLRAQHLD